MPKLVPRCHIVLILMKTPYFEALFGFSKSERAVAPPRFQHPFTVWTDNDFQS